MLHRYCVFDSKMKGGDKTMPIIHLLIGDFVSIDERVIDHKVTQLRSENKNKMAQRWETYRNVIFRINDFDSQNLVVLVDAMGNEIHISRRALILQPS